MGRALFIYWRIDAAGLQPALAAVRRAQQQLRDGWPGLVAQLYERSDPAPQATVMEAYAAPEGIDDVGQARIEAALAVALAGLPAGERHVEAFTPR